MMQQPCHLDTVALIEVQDPEPVTPEKPALPAAVLWLGIGVVGFAVLGWHLFLGGPL